MGALAVSLATSVTGFGAETREFTFPRANATFQDSTVRPDPILMGPIRIRLSSPDAKLTIRDHRLWLTPSGDGTHRCEVDVAFSGSGTLVADVDALGFTTRQQDALTLPLQSQRHAGRVRVARAAGGYLVTALENPQKVKVKIQSRLAGQLVSWCESLVVLSAAVGGCQTLNRALSSVSVPLPVPGETYFVPYGELTSEEREIVDRYLDETGSR
jgi:hypothetical protein